MTKLTRRTMLTGSVAVTAATAAGELTVTLAARAAASKQAPGFYRYKIGDFEITAINDGVRTFPVWDGFVKNVTKDQAHTALEAAYMPKGQMTVPYNVMMVNTGSRKVLIDVGWGPDGGAPLGPMPATLSVGLLPANLAAAGIDPKAIDIVVISHLHPDHIGGLKAPDGGLAFPNAEVKVPAADWTFWMSDDNMSKAPAGLTKVFFQMARKAFAGLTDKITTYEWGREIAPGITAVEASGHTPGHTAFMVASRSGRLLVQSDITNIPALFARNPDWHIIFDIDPIKAAETRHKFFDMAAAEKTLVAGYHFPFPAAGYVEKNGVGYQLVPIEWNPEL